MREFIFKVEETTIPVKGKTLVPCGVLVRCKDCKHCDDIDMYGYVQCDKGETHEPNFYCADGERRE